MKPTTFHFTIGGYYSGHFEVQLKQDELHFFVSDWPEASDLPTHVVSIKDDTDFKLLMDFLRTVKWKKSYESGILDGIQWSLKFKDDDKKLTCFGSNAFPDDYKEFAKRLKKITRKHNIKDSLLKEFKYD